MVAPLCSLAPAHDTLRVFASNSSCGHYGTLTQIQTYYNYSNHCRIQKFSDDTAVSGCVSDEIDQEYGGSSVTLSAGVRPTLSKSTPSRQRRWSWTLLQTFYDSVLASVLLYAPVCWGDGRTDRNRRKIDKLVRSSSSVLGCPLDSVETVGDRRMLAQLTSIMDNPPTPPTPHEAVGALSSSFTHRLKHPRWKEASADPSSRQQLDSKAHHSNTVDMCVCTCVSRCV